MSELAALTGHAEFLVAVAVGVVVALAGHRLASPSAAIVVAGIAASAVGGVLGASMHHAPRWTFGLVVAAAVVFGLAVGAHLRAHPRLGPALFAVSALGVYVTVPDTELARPLVGAALGVAAVAVLGLGATGALGAPALVGYLAWVAAIGGRGRPGSVVGAVACLGVVVLEPLARAVSRHARTPGTVVVVAHLALVAVAARVAGRRHSAVQASVIAAGAGLAALALLVVAARRRVAARGAGPLRVLWVIKGLGPGGAERLLVTMAEARDRAVVDYEVAYLLPWKAHLVPALETLGVRVHCLGGRRLWEWGWMLRLRRLVAEGGFDVVHVHSPAVATVTRLVLSTLPATKRPGRVSTEHNTWDSYGALTRWTNALTFSLDDAHLAVAESVRASVWAQWRDDVRVITHGVAVQDVRARRRDRTETRRGLGFDDGEVVVGTVANLRDNKDYPTLLTAAREVVSSCPDVQFIAAGQGPKADEIHELHRQLGLGERFRFLGYRDDVPRLLAACDVFVLASAKEGLPVAVMEAQAFGLPVVATDVGGVADAVGAGGVLVHPGRADELAAAIVRICSDPALRARLGRQAELGSARFDARAAARAVEDVYLDVVTGQASGAARHSV